ncbi:MAG: hypothetical protein WCL27_14380 [Betaproteobacteria bacterium]
MRETTTSTRRVVMAKVKTRPNQRHQNFTPSRPYNPEQKIVPVLFDRLSPPRVPIAIPTPSWNNWQAISLAVVLILMLLCAIYFATRSSGSRQRPLPRATPQEIVKPPPEINIRPMGYASSARSSAGEMRQGQAGGSAGNVGLSSGSIGENNLPVGKRRSEAGQSSAIDELNLVAFDQQRKLTLPTDIAGSCDIGKNGITDLSNCLALNGARVDR